MACWKIAQLGQVPGRSNDSTSLRVGSGGKWFYRVISRVCCIASSRQHFSSVYLEKGIVVKANVYLKQYVRAPGRLHVFLWRMMVGRSSTGLAIHIYTFDCCSCSSIMFELIRLRTLKKRKAITKHMFAIKMLGYVSAELDVFGWQIEAAQRSASGAQQWLHQQGLTPMESGFSMWLHLCVAWQNHVRSVIRCIWKVLFRALLARLMPFRCGEQPLSAHSHTFGCCRCSLTRCEVIAYQWRKTTLTCSEQIGYQFVFFQASTIRQC